ncbi:nucleolar transcription factor 1-B-like isoform X3 [Corticium candelabrum]|uniref:nucleolar transcription factor 1-B-like isoform X3 n=1 Tax=Corticium candelabrum TaxID=121492 RepID=UPI002E2666FB|nr:nucleolar transcription factor 1-B-like isoform X3 [Corticium candelabrum]
MGKGSRAKRRKELPVKQRRKDEERNDAEREESVASGSEDVGFYRGQVESSKGGNSLVARKKLKKKRERETDTDEDSQRLVHSPPKRHKSVVSEVDVENGSIDVVKQRKKKRVRESVPRETPTSTHIHDSDDDDNGDDELQLVAEKRHVVVPKKKEKKEADEEAKAIYNWTPEQDSRLLHFLISQCKSYPRVRKYSDYDWSQFEMEGIDKERAFKRAEHIKHHIRMTKTPLEILNEAKQMLQSDPNAFSYRGGIRSKSRKTKRLYDEPALPPSAYMVFSKLEEPKLRAKYPGQKLQFYGKTLGEMWRSMDERKKVKYYGKAEEKRKIYENEYQKFLARHPELKDRKTRAAAWPHDAPKRPKSAFMFYCEKYRPSITTGTHKEKQQKLLQTFKVESKQQQEFFQLQATEDRQRFCQELDTYIETHPDQVGLLEKTKHLRKKTLPDPPAPPPKNLYLYFCHRQRKKVLSGLSPGETPDFATLSKQFSAEWKLFDQASKDKLALKLQKSEKKYQKQFDEFLEASLHLSKLSHVQPTKEETSNNDGHEAQTADSNSADESKSDSDESDESDKEEASRDSSSEDSESDLS